MTSSIQVTILHNPRCSKSRQTLELLRSHGIEPKIVKYLENPPSKTRLKEILKKLDMQPRDLMRQPEKAYKEAGLDNPALQQEELIEAMVIQPKLIQRPIVLANEQAAIGRPPEDVLKIL